MELIDRRLVVVAGIAMIVTLLCLGCLSSLIPPEDGTKADETKELCFNSQKGSKDAKCLRIEVVDDDKSRALGLSYRDFLGQDDGMLFIFDNEGKHSFWMKEMKFPLDIIWINRDNQVVHIARNVPPCEKSHCPHHTPGNNSLYVLEINANLAEEYNITKGSRVFF